MRMLDLGFAALRDNGVTFYPGRLRDDIDALGGFIRQSVNGGVYKAGFARDQAAFDQAVAEFFAALAVLEDRLADGRPYLLGRRATEVDWLLFPTLVRLDALYAGAQTGRASCRERVCQYLLISVVAVSLKPK